MTDQDPQIQSFPLAQEGQHDKSGQIGLGARDETTDLSPAPVSPTNRDLAITSNQFTIRSILIITVIAAVASAGMGQLYRAMNGKLEDIGPFVIVTCMAPLGVMIAMNWLFRLFGKL